MAKLWSLVLTFRMPMIIKATDMAPIPQRYAVRRPKYGMTKTHDTNVPNSASPLPPTFSL
jgi:hypothetical protein